RPDINGTTAGVGPTGYDQILATAGATGTLVITDTAGSEALIAGTRGAAIPNGTEIVLIDRPSTAAIISTTGGPAITTGAAVTGGFKSLATQPVSTNFVQ